MTIFKYNPAVTNQLETTLNKRIYILFVITGCYINNHMVSIDFLQLWENPTE